MRNIDYKAFSDAQLFYSNLGYKNVTAPWKIPAAVCERVSGHRKELVGSAEQSLFYLYTRGLLEDDKKYQTITPCFRYDDVLDDYHTHEFMKLELIIFNPRQIKLEDILWDAKNFLSQYTNVEIISTVEGYDILVNKVEVGSYYEKTIDGIHYICGTGVALPRFQESLKLGYSETIIKKGVLGEISKIEEEFQEFLGAIKQNSPIMSIVEISDLLGALDSYLSKYSLNLNQAIEMSELTKRSFEEGVRHD